MPPVPRNWKGEHGKLRKRSRRSRKEIQRVRDHFLGAVLNEGKISLTDLIAKYGSEINVQNTAIDKNLVKRQLDELAREGMLGLQRDGRDLVARVLGNGQPSTDTAAAVETPRTGGDLDVIRAYARQLEEFSRTLQDQISTLVRMVEKAAR